MMYSLINIVETTSIGHHILIYHAGKTVYKQSNEKKERNKLLIAGKKCTYFLHNTESSSALGRSMDAI